jgi:hypothetical protein
VKSEIVVPAFAGTTVFPIIYSETVRAPRRYPMVLSLHFGDSMARPILFGLLLAGVPAGAAPAAIDDTRTVNSPGRTSWSTSAGAV